MPDISPKTDIESWVRPDQIFDGENLLSGFCLGFTGGRVSTIAPKKDAPGNARHVPGTLSPGFIDLQVNGGGDVMFNTTPTPQGIAAICAAHRALGSVSILPTIITDAPEITNAAADAVVAAWGKQPGLLGIHIEGPHLAPARRGTHAQRFVRPMDDESIAMVVRLRNAGIPVLYTLAPEAVRDGDIAQLVGTGAVVSLGHSGADSTTAQHALAQGATAFTHLFNAMSQMQNRAPGMVGAAINSQAYTGIICDGIHVADEMVALAIRARPAPDLCFLVSDAMPTVGGQNPEFDLYGDQVHLQNGRLINAQGGLAGAHITQAQGLHRLINVIGIAPETALRMVTSIPARAMGLSDRISIIGQPSKDLVLLDQNYAFTGFLQP